MTTASTETTVNIRPSTDKQLFMLGTRDVAAPLRQQVEEALDVGTRRIVVDFSGLLTTQSFMDEFLGVLILRHGPPVLSRVVLVNCNEEVRATAKFVASIRLKDFGQSRTET